MTPNTVFVLGAGFTKAFFPDAPMMTDDYDADNVLSKKFERIPYASRLLKLEQARAKGRINIERLMTRLDAGMPFDSVRADRSELDILLYESKVAFFSKLRAAAQTQPHLEVLLRCAKFCLDHGINCITFNYDDTLDWALSQAHTLGKIGNDLHWVPASGYGFHCQELQRIPYAAPYQVIIPNSPVWLLKLHGSVNWRLKLGRHVPVSPEDVVHLENWKGHDKWTEPARPDELTEPDPFFVPPVLEKAAITKNPLLKHLWVKAYGVLEGADRVVFIGYSLPSTDMAARFLFSEAIKQGTPIDVVVKLPEEDKEIEKRRIEDSYRTLFWAKNPRIQFEDARGWLAKFISENS